MMGITFSALLFFVGGSISFSSATVEEEIAEACSKQCSCGCCTCPYQVSKIPNQVKVFVSLEQNLSLNEYIFPEPTPDSWFVDEVQLEFSDQKISQFPSAIRSKDYHPIGLQNRIDEIRADPRLKKIKKPGRVVYELFADESGAVTQVTIKSNSNPAFSGLCTSRLRKLRFQGIKPGGQWLALPLVFIPKQ